MAGTHAIMKDVRSSPWPGDLSTGTLYSHQATADRAGFNGKPWRERAAGAITADLSASDFGAKRALQDW
jgi:hypothetical protein